MTRQNFLHLLKLEELTFQMSQERKLCDEGFGHSASGSLRDTHTHTYIHPYITMTLPRSPYNGERVINKWHSYRSGTRSPEGAEIMHHIYAKLRLCMNRPNTSRKRRFRTFDLYFDLEDGIPFQLNLATTWTVSYPFQRYIAHPNRCSRLGNIAV